MLVLFVKWLLIVQLILDFLVGVKGDFEGKKAKAPGGFSGFIASCVVVGITAFCFYTVGIFDGLFSTGG